MKKKKALRGYVTISNSPNVNYQNWKIKNLDEVVAMDIKEGDKIYIEGFGHLKVTFVSNSELIKSGFSKLMFIDLE